MSLRKTLGILAFSTQAVVAFDYNLQSRQAGLAPGELSMKDYSAIVQKRYDKRDLNIASGGGQGAEVWQHSSGRRAASGSQISGRMPLAPQRQVGTQLAETAAREDDEGSAMVCIRRGTTLNCQ